MPAEAFNITCWQLLLNLLFLHANCLIDYMTTIFSTCNIAIIFLAFFAGSSMCSFFLGSAGPACSRLLLSAVAVAGSKLFWPANHTCSNLLVAVAGNKLIFYRHFAPLDFDCILMFWLFQFILCRFVVS